MGNTLNIRCSKPTLILTFALLSFVLGLISRTTILAVTNDYPAPVAFARTFQSAYEQDSIYDFLDLSNLEN